MQTALLLDSIGHMLDGQADGGHGKPYGSAVTSDSENGSGSPVNGMGNHENVISEAHVNAALRAMTDQAVPPYYDNDSGDDYKRKGSFDSTDDSGSKRLRKSEDISIEELREKNEARYITMSGLFSSFCFFENPVERLMSRQASSEPSECQAIPRTQEDIHFYLGSTSGWPEAHQDRTRSDHRQIALGE